MIMINKMLLDYKAHDKVVDFVSNCDFVVKI